MLQLAFYFFKYRASPFSSVVELGLIPSASGSSLTIECPCHHNHPVAIPGSDWYLPQSSVASKWESNFWLLLVWLTPESPAQLCEALQFVALKQDHLNHYKHKKYFSCLSFCFTSVALKFWEILGGFSTLGSLCLSFSFVSLSASAKMSPSWSSWWIPGWLPPGGDGLLLSLLHAPAVSAVQSAGLTGPINHSWKARCSESSVPICDVLMWHSLTYTTCTWTVADWGGYGSQIWLPGSHMPLFGFEEAGLEGLGTCCLSYCCFLSVHTQCFTELKRKELWSEAIIEENWDSGW